MDERYGSSLEAIFILKEVIEDSATEQVQHSIVRTLDNVYDVPENDREELLIRGLRLLAVLPAVIADANRGLRLWRNIALLYLLQPLTVDLRDKYRKIAFEYKKEIAGALAGRD